MNVVSLERSLKGHAMQLCKKTIRKNDKKQATS
jgi:hypothetical protein